jgi:hypothetical protein
MFTVRKAQRPKGCIWDVITLGESPPKIRGLADSPGSSALAQPRDRPLVPGEKREPHSSPESGQQIKMLRQSVTSVAATWSARSCCFAAGSRARARACRASASAQAGLLVREPLQVEQGIAHVVELRQHANQAGLVEQGCGQRCDRTLAPHVACAICHASKAVCSTGVQSPLNPDPVDTRQVEKKTSTVGSQATTPVRQSP